MTGIPQDIIPAKVYTQMVDHELTERAFLDTLRPVFDANRNSLVAALSETFAVHPSVTYVIEVAPMFFGLHCVSADLELNTKFDVPDSNAEAYEDAGIDIFALTRDAIWDWIADCWITAAGPEHFPIAYANLHGYYDQYFDLSSRKWVPVTDAFPDS